MYNDLVREHFLNPRNVGELTEADGIGEVGNSADGDLIRIYLQIRDGQITQARFKTFGCAAAIATSSVATELAMGKTLAEGLQLSNEDIAAALGGLPVEKLECSNFAAEALHAAIENFQKSLFPS